MEEFKKLEPNWDSYGAKPITTIAMLSAQQLILKAPSQPYAVAPVANGGVYAEWRLKKEIVGVWVDEKGSMGYLVTFDDGTFLEVCSASEEDILMELQE
jgi:hypothetical protein